MTKYTYQTYVAAQVEFHGEYLDGVFSRAMLLGIQKEAKELLTHMQQQDKALKHAMKEVK